MPVNGIKRPESIVRVGHYSGLECQNWKWTWILGNWKCL